MYEIYLNIYIKTSKNVNFGCTETIPLTGVFFLLDTVVG